MGYNSKYTGAEVEEALDLAKSALQEYNEIDPIFTASPAAQITNEDITNWNDKPTIPTNVSQLTNDTGFITNDDSDWWYEG